MSASREDLVADLPLGNIGCDLTHGAGKLASGCKGERREGLILALYHKDVREIQRAGLDIHNHVSGFQFR
jgi:hypothetical protein